MASSLLKVTSGISDRPEIRSFASRFGPEFLGQAVVAGVDLAVEKQWAIAQRRAELVEGATLDEKIDAVVRNIRLELVAVGAGTGALAMVPFAGTLTALSSAGAELTWLTARSAELIMTLGALHGHTTADLEGRRAWVLAVLGFGDKASERLAGLAGEATRVPPSAFRAINRRLVNAVVVRYGSRRGAVALGRAMPLGLGALVGGTANFVGVSVTARSAKKFFASAPLPS